jgi:hypothetical protein
LRWYINHAATSPQDGADVYNSGGVDDNDDDDHVAVAVEGGAGRGINNDFCMTSR